MRKKKKLFFQYDILNQRTRFTRDIMFLKLQKFGLRKKSLDQSLKNIFSKWKLIAVQRGGQVPHWSISNNK